MPISNWRDESDKGWSLVDHIRGILFSIGMFVFIVCAFILIAQSMGY